MRGRVWVSAVEGSMSERDEDSGAWEPVQVPVRVAGGTERSLGEREEDPVVHAVPRPFGSRLLQRLLAFFFRGRVEVHTWGCSLEEALEGPEEDP